MQRNNGQRDQRRLSIARANRHIEPVLISSPESSSDPIPPVVTRKSDGRSRSKTAGPSRKKEKPTNVFEQQNENRKRKFRPGQKALRDIRKLQKGTDLLINRQPFKRLIYDVTGEVCDEQLRWSNDALHVIQSASEDYLVGLFEDSYLCSMHCKRVTLMAKDMMLARRIRGLGDPGNR